MANKRIFYEYNPGQEVWVIAPNIDTNRLYVVCGVVDEVVPHIYVNGVSVFYSVRVDDTARRSGRVSVFYLEIRDDEIFDTCEDALDGAVRLVDESFEYRRFTIAAIER